MADKQIIDFSSLTSFTNGAYFHVHQNNTNWKISGSDMTDSIASRIIFDASPTQKGVVQIASSYADISANPNKAAGGAVLGWVNTELNTKALAARTLTAGNGLAGGGDLTANRTITLGTPSTISGSSTNSVTADSHTHQLTITTTDVSEGTRQYFTTTRARQSISSAGGIVYNNSTGILTLTQDKPTIFSFIIDGITHDPAAIRAQIGAGTGNSNLTIGTTSTTAAAGNHIHALATTSANGFMSSADKVTIGNLKSAAFLDAQTDTNDTTANRLMRTGAGGVLGDSAAISDTSADMYGGLYQALSTSNSLSVTGYLLHQRRSSSHAGQLLFSETGRLFSRTKSLDVWQDWTEYYSNKNLLNIGTTPVAARTALELGSLSTLSSINNTNWNGTALSITNGGTGATTSLDALINLGAQATLVSGTNIRTINGESLVGAGDIVIARSYDNHLALTADLDNIPIGSVVSTRGCFAIGDGGYGTFDTISSTALTVDGYSVIGGSGKYLVLRPTNGVFQVEQFGARGDGLNNDTAAFVRALARGLPVSVVNGKTYVVSGLSTTGGSLYCEGRATLKNVDGSSDFIIRNTSGTLYLRGVDFDGSANSRRCLYLTGGGVFASLCEFKNATHSSGFGIGVEIESSTLPSVFVQCKASSNDYHGISVAQSPHLCLDRCEAISNGRNGFHINNYDTTLTKRIERVTISDCYSEGNGGAGITLGNPYNDNNYLGENFGHDNMVCTNVTIDGFTAKSNTVYGMSVSCIDGKISNITTDANIFGGLLVNGLNIAFSNIVVTNNVVFGVDIGGADQITINGGRCTGNATTVSGSESGFLVEASQDIHVKGVYISGNGRIGDGFDNVRINAVGGTGDGRFFHRAARRVHMECIVDCSDGRRGMRVSDTPYYITDANKYYGTDFTLFTRYAARPNHINPVYAKMEMGQIVSEGLSSGILVIPDIPANVLTNSTDDVAAIRNSSFHFFRGKIAFISVTNEGSGYTSATVSISGDGTGATGTAIIHGGKIIGVMMANYGANYTSATVTIVGDGTGATATAQIGTQVINGATVQISCNLANTLTRNGSPIINSPNSVSASTISVPAFGSFKMVGRYQNWLITSSNANL